MPNVAISRIADINPPARIPNGVNGGSAVSFIPMSDVSESGRWTFKQTRPLRSVSVGFTAFEEGDVLLAKITPCLENGKGAHATGLENGIGFGSTEFHVLRARQGYEPRFLFHLSQWRHFRRSAEAQMVGSAGQQRVPRAFFDEFLVEDFGAGEQVRIAEILDTLDTAIFETEAIIAKLKAVKQGLLHDLLTRGIDANGELRPPQAEAPHLYKESPLGWIPKDWNYAPLVSKIDFPEGQVDPRRLPFRDWVLVAPDHIESGTGRLLSTATAAEQQAISGKYVVEAGDVVYSKIRPYLRKAILAVTRGLCSADMYPLRPKAGVNPRYLLAVVLGDQFTRFTESVSMRSGFPKINRTEMAEFSMGWPFLEEQALIAQVLMEADVKQESAEQEHQKLRLLKAGLMDDLLTGRVRVTPLLAAEQAERSA